MARQSVLLQCLAPNVAHDHERWNASKCNRNKNAELVLRHRTSRLHHRLDSPESYERLQSIKNKLREKRAHWFRKKPYNTTKIETGGC